MTSENPKLTEQVIQYNNKVLNENINEFGTMLTKNILELENSFDYIQNEIEKKNQQVTESLKKENEGRNYHLPDV